MHKLIYLLILAGFLASCGGDNNIAEIRGEIKGMENGSVIYVYGYDELSNVIDTIRVDNGRINHDIPLDTLVQVMLLVDNRFEYPLYLDGGQRVTIRGDLSQSDFLDVKGVTPNEQLTQFNRSLLAIPEPTDSLIQQSAEEFIRANQTSLASVYLLDKYFVQQNEPDMPRILELISIMDGVLQDKPYVEKLKTTIEEAQKAEVGRTAISFSLPNAEGKHITRVQHRNKYLLINFWASWCDSCRVANTELKQIYRKYKDKSNFSMLGISLDMDRADWLEAIKNDTLAWEQVSDFSGWESTTAKQYAVFDIPYNILLGTDGRVLARGLKGDSLRVKLEGILK